MTEDGSMPVVLSRSRAYRRYLKPRQSRMDRYVYAVRGDGEVATLAQCSDGCERKGHCRPSNSRS
jgi:hypothetical protein